MGECDPEVWRQGHALVCLRETPKHIAEELCKRMRTSTLLVDWHYCGGRPVLLYIGKLEEARSALEKQLTWFNDEVKSYYKTRYPDYPYKGYLSMDDVTDSPTAKSIGQVWNSLY
jgi:hypothetical protein